MASIKDKFFRAMRANMNDLLDRVRDFEDEGGFQSIFEDLERELRDEQGRDGSTGGRRESSRTRSTKSSDQKTIRDYYANLEVPYGADMKTVKKSYRRLMQKYHPDRYANDPEMEELATELSQELSQAYKAV
ncbi:MAG: J domain-containing protein, partial [Myxococcota bacterium]